MWTFIPGMHLVSKFITPQIMPPLTSEGHMISNKFHVPRYLLGEGFMVHANMRTSKFVTEILSVLPL